MLWNEALFLGHVALVLVVVLGARRLGKAALITVMALLAVIANLFVLKQTVLFGLHVTCSDVYVIGSMLSLNLLQEHYGQREGQRAIWITFLAMVVFGLFSQFQLLYQPSPFDSKHPAYAALLTAAPRIVIASFAAYLASQFLNIKLFKLFRWGSFALRSTLILVICQLADTAIFAVLGLWGLVHSLIQIIAMSFAIKIVVILCAAPLTRLGEKVFAKP